MNEEERQGIFDPEMLPDVNTAEAIRYGSAYRFHKNSQWIWSMIEENLSNRLRGLESQIMDTEFALNIMKNNSSVIKSPRPPFKARQNRDIFTLRDWGRLKNTLDQLDIFRKKNEMWCRKQAIEEYISQLRANGRITPEDWKICTAMYNMEPISYDYIRGHAREQRSEEKIDWGEFVDALMTPDDSILDTAVSVEEAEPPEAESVPKEDLSTMRDYVSTFLEHPLKDVLAMLQEKDEGIDAADEWISASGWGWKDILQELMDYAEAA